ncbi:hypothetical protein [Actinospongicola halichondriae]|uniref:hypothetical protein n=1 Tax=Actinospongicola halichondriae TaxID=3236844 RepID=UPI003D4A772F
MSDTTLDLRATDLTIAGYPGNEHTLTLTFPEGELSGSWFATIGGTAVDDISVDDDDLTIDLTIPTTEGVYLLAIGQTGGSTVIYGEVVSTTAARQQASSTSLTITTGSGSVAVTFAGPQGIQGEQGIQGPQGIQGDQGIQGLPGADAELSDSDPEPVGATADPGEATDAARADHVHADVAGVRYVMAGTNLSASRVTGHTDDVHIWVFDNGTNPGEAGVNVTNGNDGDLYIVLSS